MQPITSKVIVYFPWIKIDMYPPLPNKRKKMRPPRSQVTCPRSLCDQVAGPGFEPRLSGSKAHCTISLVVAVIFPSSPDLIFISCILQGANCIAEAQWFIHNFIISNYNWRMNGRIYYLFRLSLLLFYKYWVVQSGNVRTRRAQASKPTKQQGSQEIDLKLPNREYLGSINSTSGPPTN